MASSHSAPDEVIYADGRTGEVLARIPGSTRPFVLSDGRLIAISRADELSKLRLYRRDGTVEREIAIPTTDDSGVIAELDAERVLLQIENQETIRLAVVDLQEGALQSGVTGRLTMLWSFGDPRTKTIDPTHVIVWNGLPCRNCRIAYRVWNTISGEEHPLRFD